MIRQRSAGLVWMIATLASLVLLFAVSQNGWAQYPTKPITFYVGFEAGGPTDITARAISEPASKILRQPIVVVNKPGGTGAVALALLKDEKPDGYTICNLALGAIISQHMRKLPFDVTKDFTFIMRYGDYPFPVLIRADSPWKTFKELADYAKAHPGKIKYGTSGTGSIYHLAMERLGMQEGIQWTHIPFKGCHPAQMALLGGHIDVMVCPAEFTPYIKSDRLKLIATFGRKRLDNFPDVPTWKELGYNIAMSHMAAVVGPKGIPRPIVDKLHEAFKQALDNPEFKRTMANLDMPIVYRNPEELANEVKDLSDEYGKIIAQMGLQKKE